MAKVRRKPGRKTKRAISERELVVSLDGLTNEVGMLTNEVGMLIDEVRRIKCHVLINAIDELVEEIKGLKRIWHTVNTIGANAPRETSNDESTT